MNVFLVSFLKKSARLKTIWRNVKIVRINEDLILTYFIHFISFNHLLNQLLLFICFTNRKFYFLSIPIKLQCTKGELYIIIKFLHFCYLMMGASLSSGTRFLKDFKLQRNFYRSVPSRPMQEQELWTIVYGLPPSAFLAQWTLQ